LTEICENFLKILLFYILLFPFQYILETKEKQSFIF